MPKSTTARRILLNLTSGDRFKTELYKYCLPMVRKGVPSMVRDLSPLYKDAEKAKIIGDMLFGF